MTDAVGFGAGVGAFVSGAACCAVECWTDRGLPPQLAWLAGVFGTATGAILAALTA